MKNFLVLMILSAVLFTSFSPTAAYSQGLLEPSNPLSPLNPLNPASPIWDDDDSPSSRPATPAKPMPRGEKIALAVTAVIFLLSVLGFLFGPEIVRNIRRRRQ